MKYVTEEKQVIIGKCECGAIFNVDRSDLSKVFDKFMFNKSLTCSCGRSHTSISGCEPSGGKKSGNHGKGVLITTTLCLLVAVGFLVYFALGKSQSPSKLNHTVASKQKTVEKTPLSHKYLFKNAKEVEKHISFFAKMMKESPQVTFKPLEIRFGAEQKWQGKDIILQKYGNTKEVMLILNEDKSVKELAILFSFYNDMPETIFLMNYFINLFTKDANSVASDIKDNLNISRCKHNSHDLAILNGEHSYSGKRYKIEHISPDYGRYSVLLY